MPEAVEEGTEGAGEEGERGDRGESSAEAGTVDGEEEGVETAGESEEATGAGEEGEVMREEGVDCDEQHMNDAEHVVSMNHSS